MCAYLSRALLEVLLDENLDLVCEELDFLLLASQLGSVLYHLTDQIHSVEFTFMSENAAP